MGRLMNNIKTLTVKKSLMMVLIIISSTFTIYLIVFFAMSLSFKSNNSQVMGGGLHSAYKTLKSQKIGSEFVITYEPVDTLAPFTILILSGNGVTFDELIEKGLDSLIVEDLFSQLQLSNIIKSSGELKNISRLIVYQNDTISFATAYRRWVDVKTTQIINGTGDTDIIVQTIGRSPRKRTSGILLIELKLRN